MTKTAEGKHLSNWQSQSNPARIRFTEAAKNMPNFTENMAADDAARPDDIKTDINGITSRFIKILQGDIWQKKCIVHGKVPRFTDKEVRSAFPKGFFTSHVFSSTGYKKANDEIAEKESKKED